MHLNQNHLRLNFHLGCAVVHSFQDFAAESHIIIANRYSPELEQVKHKLYTRDIYGKD